MRTPPFLARRILERLGADDEALIGDLVEEYRRGRSRAWYWSQVTLVYRTVEDLREATLPALRRYWDDAAAVLRLVGRSWLLDQVNASNKTAVSH